MCSDPGAYVGRDTVGAGLCGAGAGAGALPGQVPGRVPPRVDRGEGLVAGVGGGLASGLLALVVEPAAEGEAVVDGGVGHGQGVVGGGVGAGVVERGFGVGGDGPGAGGLVGEADVGQEALLVGVQAVVVGALQAQPGTLGGGEAAEVMVGVEPVAGLDLVVDVLPGALPRQAPGRAPPGIDRCQRLGRGRWRCAPAGVVRACWRCRRSHRPSWKPSWTVSISAARVPRMAW